MRFPATGDSLALDQDLVVASDKLGVMERLPAGAFDLVYLDPPVQHRSCAGPREPGGPGRRWTRTTAAGDRVGFGRRRYRSQLLQTLSYDDAFGDYLAFLELSGVTPVEENVRRRC